MELSSLLTQFWLDIVCWPAVTLCPSFWSKQPKLFYHYLYFGIPFTAGTCKSIDQMEHNLINLLTVISCFPINAMLAMVNLSSKYFQMQTGKTNFVSVSLSIRRVLPEYFMSFLRVICSYHCARLWTCVWRIVFVSRIMKHASCL